MNRLIAHIPRRFTPLSWGGTETVVAGLTARHQARGLDATILTSTALDPQCDWACGGVPVRRFPYFYPEWPLSSAQHDEYDHKGGNLVSPALARELARLPNLALVHMHTGNRLGAQALRVARRRGIPCVWSIHGGHFALSTAAYDRAAVRDARRGIEWGRALSWWLGTRQLPQDVDAIICLNQEEYQAARAALPKQRVRLIPNGVDDQAFAKGDRRRGRSRLGIADDRLLVVSVGRLDEVKDQLTLVEAWRALDRPDCDLALVGAETAAGYRARCSAAAQGSRGRLVMSDNVPPAEVPDILSAADLVVLPSRSEAFGITVIEAWACRRAVIASLVQGPRWLLAEAGADTGFPPGDRAALCALLTALLDDAPRRAALGAAGAAVVAKRFTWDALLRATLELYAELGVTSSLS